MSISIILLMFWCVASAKYLPTWESLDSRPLPTWFDEAKFGIFIHWGVFSVPSFHNEWFWWDWQGRHAKDSVEFMRKNYPPGFTYADFAKQFTAEFFDPKEWVRIFEASGARYIVFTSKHHDGYTNWPSKYSFSWNSKAVGPNRDIVGELANATKESSKLRFGLYHSMYEWFHPWYVTDKKNNFTTDTFVKDKTLPELYELVNTYKPDLIWSDGDWEAPEQYWKSKEFLAWLYNESPVRSNVIVNDRWGKGVICHHGGYLTCHSRYNPGRLVNRKWENGMTIDKYSWGFRRTANIADFLSVKDILKELITTVSCNGNLLLNVGPTHAGIISPIFQERLLDIGSWLKENGEGIYGSKPWTYQNDTQTPGVWYTSQKNSDKPDVYAFLLNWPNHELYLASPLPSEHTKVTLLGYYGLSLKWSRDTSRHGMLINIPQLNVRERWWAWTLKLTNIDN